jgi:2-polyprenyl-6-methoxyphenol hydroxylase-like FAD-dependent oxidoreductase
VKNNLLDFGTQHWAVCEACLGRGKKSRRLTKKARLHYQLAYEDYLRSDGTATEPARPKASLFDCPDCKGTGLRTSHEYPNPDQEKFPHVAIIGAGIGGVALAVACLQRGIPFTLFERDHDVNVRSQGYGLTLQQANRAIKKLGISKLDEGIISTRHVVHTPDGEVVGEWGSRRWVNDELNNDPKRSNMHIARQAFRHSLLAQLGVTKCVQWGHQLVDLSANKEGFKLRFAVDGVEKSTKADLVVGADGIRSAVRSLLLGDEVKPLRYLNCIVILGICALDDLPDLDSPLLDGATVFQTANGQDRIYVMPYSANAVMWQLSCPMSESEAKELSAQGSAALKNEAIKRVQWHTPMSTYISGYPVYDREILGSELEDKGLNVTLIGDAAHPMSPFKGQGANQALLDAIALAQYIYTAYHYTGWQNGDLRTQVLTPFEQEMLERSSVKVNDSAAAVDVLHSAKVFEGGDQPRGLRKK